MPFLRLLLGKGTDPQPKDRREHKRRVIYTMAGFKSPDHPENPELWTDKDRNASAAMLSVLSRMRRDNLSGRMGTNPMTGEPGIPPTASFVDEGNMVTADPAGRGYLTVNLRQGRSLNSAAVLHRPAGPRHAGDRETGQRGVRRGQPVRNGARVQATIQRGGPGGVGRVAQQR